MQWGSASNSGAKNSRLRNAAEFAETTVRRQALGWTGLLSAKADVLVRGMGLVDAPAACCHRAQAGSERSKTMIAQPPFATIGKFEGCDFVAILATTGASDLADRQGQTEGNDQGDQNEYHHVSSFSPHRARVKKVL
jgi:hypothetical protein